MSVKKSVRIELNCFLYFNYFEFEYLENLGSLRSDLEEDMLAGGGSKKKKSEENLSTPPRYSSAIFKLL